MNRFKEIFQILSSDSKDNKIKVLGSLAQSKNPEMIKKIISKLDDPEIAVRGEAFSSLLLNENEISEFLIQSLSSTNKNIKAFSALILANREDKDAIPALELLTKDSSSMVRSCALGGLGYLCSTKSSTVIRNCLEDEILQVRKSALEAFFKIGGQILPNEFERLTNDADDELNFLIKKFKKKGNGPGGI